MEVELEISGEVTGALEGPRLAILMPGLRRGGRAGGAGAEAESADGGGGLGKGMRGNVGARQSGVKHRVCFRIRNRRQPD